MGLGKDGVWLCWDERGRTHLGTSNVVMTGHMGGKSLDGIWAIYIMLYLHLALSLSRWHCQAF
jgi:hypothetical protein